MTKIITSKYIKLIFPIFIFFVCTMKAQTSNKSDEPVTVNSVDLNKYVGTWYEIAKIPNSFQKKCASNTTATYILRNDGNIDVINRCIEKDGSISEGNS